MPSIESFKILETTQSGIFTVCRMENKRTHRPRFQVRIERNGHLPELARTKKGDKTATINIVGSGPTLKSALNDWMKNAMKPDLIRYQHEPSGEWLFSNHW